jgi:16S rRNA (guanine966-N2)-methyltransferase
VRVIGGRSRGRLLYAPPGPGLRPTSDRVREAIFDILYSRGGVEGWSVLDLFAGTGALGIEALSRGATRATFVDSDRTSVAAIGRNLATLAGGDEPAPVIEVVRSDAARFLERRPAHYDVVFCDPPYTFEGWAEVLGLLDADVAVLESSRPLDVPEGLEVVKVYRYGGTLVTLAEGRPAPQRKAKA